MQISVFSDRGCVMRYSLSPSKGVMKGIIWGSIIGVMNRGGN